MPSPSSHKPSPDFSHFKDERLRFWICVVREVRLGFEAFAASRWMTIWISSMALGVPAAWLIKAHLLH